MNREEIKQKYIEAAITIGANQGLDAVTMRSMSEHAGINTSYLYRTFDDVNEVKLKAFLYVNKVFVHHVMKHIEIYDDGVISAEKRVKFFEGLWKDIKLDAEKFEYFLRYYYGCVFPEDYVNEKNKEDMKPLLDKIQPLFKKNANLNRILLHQIEDLVKYAVLVRNGKCVDNEETDREVFRYMFEAIGQYLKSSSQIEQLFEQEL